MKKQLLVLGLSCMDDGIRIPPYFFSSSSLLFYLTPCTEIPSLGAKVNCLRLITGEVNSGAGGVRKRRRCCVH